MKNIHVLNFLIPNRNRPIKEQQYFGHFELETKINYTQKIILYLNLLFLFVCYFGEIAKKNPTHIKGY